MRVFNEEKTKELSKEDIDFKKGKLVEDVLTTHIPAQEFIEEEWHYEVVAEYENGGQDVQKVIDVEGQPAIEEHDETEDILVYKIFTEEELQKIEDNNALYKLEAWFDRDYTKYEQMLTRRQALGIEDSIQDDIRQKTYTSLAELYAEAEIVASEIKDLRK